MQPDIKINQQATLSPILDIAASLGISGSVDPYGKFKAKINLTADDVVTSNGKLILVTAITPTPAGEGKTTTTIGLADALRHIGLNSLVCLREPALGPVFGMKGGATGGGFSQVAPMEDINLHFTGDFAAIAAAHNLLAALIDNHIYHGNELDIQQVVWRRVIDMNDRSLRDKFDIVVASEVMAVFCLVDDIDQLRQRLSNITVGYTSTGQAVTAGMLQAQDAMVVLLKDAIKPNLVQTLEHTPAIIHGGPFANIAHGCNSVIATRLGLKLADYVVTEAGFASDLGAEKFVDIKCRQSGLRPDACVIVATVRALKHHGQGNLIDGLANLGKHIDNVKNHYQLPCVVAINRFSDDLDVEMSVIINYCVNLGVTAVESTHWADGGTGAVDLAHSVVAAITNKTTDLQFVYQDTDDLFTKIEKIARKIYGTKDVVFPLETTNTLHQLQRDGYGHYPICVAKTPVSLSTDSTLLGAPKDFTCWVTDVELRTGAEFIVVKMGKILTLPGLPKEPNSMQMGVDWQGQVYGLS
jgi:formate--tetrahydrofolate ligase